MPRNETQSESAESLTEGGDLDHIQRMNQNPTAILFALKEEIRPLLQRARTKQKVVHDRTVVREIVLEGRPFLMCQTGMGMNPAHEGAEFLIHEFHPSCLISAGYAGAVQPHLKTGDLILVSEIRSEAKDRFLPDPALFEKVRTAIGQTNPSALMGPLLTRWKVGHQEDKRVLSQTDVLAVDMETAAIAAVAEKLKTPFVSLRVIFDTLEDEIPFGNPTADEEKPWKFLIRNPKAILSVPKFFRMNQVCQRKLSLALEVVLKGFAPSN